MPDTTHDMLDAARYRRLRILGVAVTLTGTEMMSLARFQKLDAIVDDDIRAVPNRGEFGGLIGAGSPTPLVIDPEAGDEAGVIAEMDRLHAAHAGFRQLADGVSCKCIHFFTDLQGRGWCCTPAARTADSTASGGKPTV